MLVAGQRVDVSAAFEQQPGGLEMPEEAREPERVKSILAEGIREGGIVVEKLADPLGLPACGGLEYVELRVRGQQLVGSCLVACVQGLKQL